MKPMKSNNAFNQDQDNQKNIPINNIDKSSLEQVFEMIGKLFQVLIYKRLSRKEAGSLLDHHSTKEHGSSIIENEYPLPVDTTSKNSPNHNISVNYAECDSSPILQVGKQEPLHECLCNDKGKFPNDTILIPLDQIKVISTKKKHD